MTIRQVMIGVAVLALALAPLAEAVRRPSGRSIGFAVMCDLFWLPVLVTLGFGFSLSDPRARRRTFSILWVYILMIVFTPMFGLLAFGVALALAAVFGRH